MPRFFDWFFIIQFFVNVVNTLQGPVVIEQRRAHGKTSNQVNKL